MQVSCKLVLFALALGFAAGLSGCASGPFAGGNSGPTVSGYIDTGAQTTVR